MVFAHRIENAFKVHITGRHPDKVHETEIFMLASELARYSIRKVEYKSHMWLQICSAAGCFRKLGRVENGGYNSKFHLGI